MTPFVVVLCLFASCVKSSFEKKRSQKMAGEVLVDALPYIDQGYDEPGVREAVSLLKLWSLLMLLFYKCGC